MRIAEIVFGGRSRARPVFLLVGGAVALAIHLLPALIVAFHVLPHDFKPTPAAKQKELVVELEKPKPVPKAEEPKPAPESPKQTAAPAAAAAQAAKLAGQAEPDADAPVDLSGETFVTGNAVAFAGGYTMAEGTSEKPVPSENVAPKGRPEGQGPAKAAPVDHSAPVSLHEEEWHCPWPSEAEDSAIDHETVIIKVGVGAGGKVDHAEIVRDPGHGFGAAAIACARRTRFTPAKDVNGRPTAGESPPIRVHFRR